MEIKDITGQRFGRLIAKSIAYKDKHGSWKWNCDCDCGNSCIVDGGSLRSGTTQSCGCYKKERLRFNHLQHGVSRTALAAVRNAMIQRCCNSNSKDYPNYGGRGITVCAEWKSNPISFYDWAFSHGYKKGLCIERINNDGNYEPSNCKWATKEEQNNNQRSNRFLTYNGETKNLTQWAKEKKVSRYCLDDRLKRGWTIEETLTTPVNTRLKPRRKKNGK